MPNHTKNDEEVDDEYVVESKEEKEDNDDSVSKFANDDKDKCDFCLLLCDISAFQTMPVPYFLFPISIILTGSSPAIDSIINIKGEDKSLHLWHPWSWFGTAI